MNYEIRQNKIAALDSKFSVEIYMFVRSPKLCPPRGRGSACICRDRLGARERCIIARQRHNFWICSGLVGQAQSTPHTRNREWSQSTPSTRVVPFHFVNITSRLHVIRKRESDPPTLCQRHRNNPQAGMTQPSCQMRHGNFHKSDMSRREANTPNKEDSVLL